MPHAIPPAILAAFLNLATPDLLIIFFLVVGPCIGTVLLFLFLRPRKSDSPGITRQPPPLSAREASIAELLRDLDLRKQQNLVSEREYEEQRDKIIRDA